MANKLPESPSEMAQFAVVSFIPVGAHTAVPAAASSDIVPVPEPAMSKTTFVTFRK